MSTKNARIESTMFGLEDHGIMTFWIHLDYGGSGQGMGGIATGGTVSRECRSWFFPEFARQLLLATGVDSWDKLPGTPVRVEPESDDWSSRLVRIGHFLDDKWVDIRELQAATKAELDALESADRESPDSNEKSA